MRDYENGWSGLRAYAASCGVVEVSDSDDVAANKIKAVIQGTQPEQESTPAEEDSSADDSSGSDQTGGDKGSGDESV